MFVDYTPAQRALEQQVRTLMAEMMTPELRAELRVHEGGGPLYRAALKSLGQDGWLGLGWSEAVGGQGRSMVDQFIFFDEMHRSGFPIPLLTLCTVGPTLAAFGTPEQKARYLPPILRGESHFSIGYTEPSAGTDLASLQTRAVLDEATGEYVITGQKVFMSLATYADFIWMAVRTDPEVPKHKGISVVIVPADAKGLSMTPIENLADSDISTVYLDKVRVPVANRVGPENGGWRMITSQLNHERVALMMVGPVARLIEETRDWAIDTSCGGDQSVFDLPWVQHSLGWLQAHVRVLRLMNWRQAWHLDQSEIHMHEASAIKVFGSEMYVEACRRLLEILGSGGVLKAGSPAALLRGEVERYYRAMLVLTFGGGTNEVQRDIVSMAGLRMPRVQR